jgi:aquaporin Z
MKIPWSLLLAELAGTALLIAAGVSIVILDFGRASPVVTLLPDAGTRRLVTGFLFGTTGGLIAVSIIGKVSGAHINPVVTLAFWLEGKMSARHALSYVVAQLAGGTLGALPLLAWGPMGSSVGFGVTLPGAGYSAWTAALGEMITTFALIVGLFTFVGHRRIRPFTPLLFPFLYAVMVYLEAPVSGTSTNPARSFGPMLVSRDYQGWWVYWIGPAVGASLGVAFLKLPGLRRLEREVAKLYHFEHDPHRIFHRVRPTSQSL